MMGGVDLMPSIVAVISSTFESKLGKSILVVTLVNSPMNTNITFQSLGGKHRDDDPNIHRAVFDSPIARKCSYDCLSCTTSAERRQRYLIDRRWSHQEKRVNAR